MNLDPNSIFSALALLPIWEVIAMTLGIAYIILIAKESLWGWVFGFFSTLIYTILFWEGALVSSSFLNFYYMIMAGYGYYSWNRGVEEKMLTISTYPISKNISIIAIGAVTTFIIGYLSTTYSDANYAYMDSFVMVFSIIATWMLTQKILENWIYWLIIDSVAIVLYWNNGYLVTVILFSIYIILGVYGYVTWKKEFNADN